MKNAQKTVHITTCQTYLYGLLLLLLTLQNHYIQSTSNYQNFDHLFAPLYWCYNVSATNILVQLTWLHQYIGGTVLAAPIGKETLTSCKFYDFADF